MPATFKKLAGSYRTPIPQGRAERPAAPDEPAEVLVRVRARHTERRRASRLMAMNAKPPGQRTYASREDLSARRSADPEDLARVEAFAHRYHLTVRESNVPRRTVRLAGTVADLSRAFQTRLQEYGAGGAGYRGRTGYLHVPANLANVVEGVFGLDNRPAARPHLRAPSSNRRTSDSFSVLELAQLYHFPEALDGSGECIALIELNGVDTRGAITGTGYKVSDLEAYFKKNRKTVAHISPIGVYGGLNKPGVDEIGDAEATIDIEIAGAIAPGAKIAVYFAPDTDAGFLEAVTAALYDDVRKPSVISISWGSPEDHASGQFRKALNDVLEDAAELGVTVCCEAGDWGSMDQPPQSRDGKLHVEFPATSPYVLTCGGSRIIRGRASQSYRETAWNDGGSVGAGGGGVSDEFPRPAYQSKARVPVSPNGNRGRGIPDVAGNAVGYRAWLRGKEIVVHGTSNVAPLWAGLIARINQGLVSAGLNRAGFLNPLLYGPAGARALQDITHGDNHIGGRGNKYRAGKGWDACTGLGSPNGELLLKQLQRAQEK